jgi:hypothetical protein
LRLGGLFADRGVSGGERNIVDEGEEDINIDNDPLLEGRLWLFGIFSFSNLSLLDGGVIGAP